MPTEKERELVERILGIEAEQAKRRASNKLLYYNAGEKKHLKQLEFHRSIARNRWVFGGNRSGKTECGAAEAVWMCRGNHPFRKNRRDVKGWAVSVTREVQRDVAQAKVLSYLSPEWIERVTMSEGTKEFPEGGVIDTVYIKNVFGGISSLTFKSCQQGRESFQGASLDFVWFDEEPPRDIYEECRMRVLDRSGDIFGTMTPLKGLTWVYDEIYLNASSDPEIWTETMEWADNPYLKEEEVKRLSAVLSAEELESRRYGRFRADSGLVYPEFDPSVHVIEPFEIPFDWQSAISIDPGLKNPLSCHFYCQDFDGTIYVVAEHYEAGLDVRSHAEKIDEIATNLDWRRRTDGRLEALIDSAANQRTLASAKSVSELFFEYGIAVNTNVNKDMFTGISRVRRLFAERPPAIYIFNTCRNMIKELKGYWWGGGDVPVKKDDHAMDDLRYYVMSRPENREPKPKPNRFQLHKTKLMRSCRVGK